MRSILVAASLVAAAATSAQAGNINFSLQNSTSVAVTEFYISPPSSNNWEENLVESPIRPGAQVPASIVDTGSCVYDVRTVFADGESTEDRGWNFCDDPNYEITEE